MDTIVDHLPLPNQDLAYAWRAIMLPEQVRHRLVAQALLALQLRKHFPFEAVPVHGLLVLSGPPSRVS